MIYSVQDGAVTRTMAKEPWQLGDMKIRAGDLVMKANDKSMSGVSIVEELQSVEDCELTILQSSRFAAPEIQAVEDDNVDDDNVRKRLTAQQTENMWKEGFSITYTGKET